MPKLQYAGGLVLVKAAEIPWAQLVSLYRGLSTMVVNHKT